MMKGWPNDQSLLVGFLVSMIFKLAVISSLPAKISSDLKAFVTYSCCKALAILQLLRFYFDLYSL